jgi:hypothetical protein
MIGDPLLARLDAIDQSLEAARRTWKCAAATPGGHVDLRSGLVSNTPNCATRRCCLSEAIRPAGTDIYTYLVRASTPGVFNVIPSTAQEFYFPEVYGRGAGSTFEIRP